MRTAIAILTAFLAAGAANAAPARNLSPTAQPQNMVKRCMTRPRMEALMTYALPSLIDGIASAIRLKDCSDVTEAIEPLSPLPAQNLGRRAAMLAILGSNNGGPGENAFRHLSGRRGQLI